MLDEAAVRRLDKSGIIDFIRAMPDHLVRGLELSAGLGPMAVNRRTTVVGMGGSGIAGDVLASWLAEERGVPVAVVRDFGLPPWLGEGDLLVAVSYSGNTVETLSAVAQGISQGCDVVGIASGGILHDLSRDRGLPLIPLPPGVVAPRAAFGYILGGLAGLFDTDGLAGEVREAADLVRVRGSTFDSNVPVTRNAAKTLARKLEGRTPIIYATAAYAPVARRWQTQFNENAKVMAWASTLPEADHNELVGWSEDPAAKRFAPIFLRDPGELGNHGAMLDATRDLVRRRAKVEEVRADGPTLLSRMLATIHFGDWVSLYLAVLRKVDPTPVTVIVTLKKRLAKKG